MSKNSYVYILVDKSLKKFKIGLTKDILQRYKTLNSLYGNFSIKDSYLIKCKNDYAKKLEKILHFTFSDFNLDIKSHVEGHTEWFDICCLNDLIKFVKEIKQINKNVIEIKQNIKEIEILNKNSLSKNKALKEKKEYRMKQLKKENILKTITFLKTIKKMVKSKNLHKKDNFTLIFENITFSEAKIFSNKLLLTLEYETAKVSGGFVIVGKILFSKDKLYVYFNFEFLNKYKHIEQIKRPYILLSCFFKKYFEITI